MFLVPRRLFGQPSTAQQWHRLADLESLRTWATCLLTVANQRTRKECLRLVIGELEDAFQLLHRQNADSGPRVWTMVDLTTTHARLRLRMIADMFGTARPDAEFKPADEPPGRGRRASVKHRACKMIIPILKRPARRPAAGDVVVIKVARHYHVGRVQTVGTVLAAIEVSNHRDEAITAASMAVTGSQRVFLSEHAGSLHCVEIDCTKPH